MTFDVFLNSNNLVSHMLYRHVMKVARIEKFDVISEVIMSLFVYETFHGGCELIGRTKTCDFVDKIFERNIRIRLNSAFRIGIDP